MAQRAGVGCLGIAMGTALGLSGCGSSGTGSGSNTPPPAAPPTITSLSPVSAAVGAVATISGMNFGASVGTSTVTFNGTAATPTSWSARSIVVPVPAGATTGNVVITVGGQASAGLLFTVLATPSITSLSPASGAAGVVVTILGMNFGGTQGTSTVTFNGTPATPTSWSATSIVVPVPAAATTGDVVVTVNGVASAGSLFTVSAVSISPPLAAVVITTQVQQFSPSVTGGGGVNWSVDAVPSGNPSVGTISASGLYTPPSTAGTHTITATSVVNSANSASASVAVTDLAGVFTHHDSLARDGTNTQEYGLTPSTVNSNTFGKLFSCPVDGVSFTQPLWVPSLSISGGTHNVVFVATAHDSLFAFDADASPCVTYWQAHLLDTAHGGTSGETSVVWNNVGYGLGDIYPEVGVTGTPVIDPATSTIYVVSTSENGSQTFFQRLHALDLASGNEKFSAPVNIAASVPGNGDGSSGGMVSFSPQTQNQRPSLALADGTVYIGWSAHEDASPWHGWFIGYSAGDVQQQTSFFNTSPNGGAGGIWSGGGAPAVDAEGNIYLSIGNGVFDANSTTLPDNDYGDSVLKLAPFTGTTSNGENLNLVDSFTPDDQSCLSNSDTDLGAGAAVLLPDQTTGPLTHLLVQIGKEGVVYLINRDDMGRFSGQSNSCGGANSQIVQSFTGSQSGFYGTPAFWQNSLYFAGSLDAGNGDFLKLFTFNPSTGQFDTAPASQSSHYYNFPGASPSVSSQGPSNGIVWAIDASAYGYANMNAGTNCFQVPVPAACSGPAVLHAYDASNLLMEYWSSAMAANNRDQAGTAVKFVPPTVANGKVYVSTRTEVDVYGLSP